jgi:hypothetical protein
MCKGRSEQGGMPGWYVPGVEWDMRSWLFIIY